MPDLNGKLVAADIPVVNNYIARNSPDNCLTCPVTGGRVPFGLWMVSDRLCMIPVSGANLQPDPSKSSPVLTCRSPAGGVVFLDALVVGVITRATLQ